MANLSRFDKIIGRSLARRVFIGAALWSVIMLVLGAIALTAVYRTQTLRLLESDLNETLIALSREIDYLPDGRITDNDRDLLANDSRYQTPLSGRYWAIVAIDEGGAPTGSIRSKSLWDGDLPIPKNGLQDAVTQSGAVIFGNTIGPNADRLRVGIRSITIQNRPTPLILMAAADSTRFDQGARRFRNLLIGAMLFLVGGLLVAMLIQVRLSLSPLRRMQADLAEVREGNATKLGDDYPDEVRAVTGELNMLLDHNREVVERAQTHVGNLAHALKTPLAVLRNEATGETVLDDVVRRQSEAMRGNVEHYLKRAQAAARAQAIGARADIKPVLEGLVRLLNRLFDAQAIDVSVLGKSDYVFRGEAQDFEEMLGNLMENACKWAETCVQVSVEANGPDTLYIHVDDDGGGLAPEEREAAMQRGVRLDEMTPGTGLGLSIVADVAALYGGALALDDSPLGGLRATLRLPRAAKGAAHA